jgi:hypothetical protein
MLTALGIPQKINRRVATPIRTNRRFAHNPSSTTFQAGGRRGSITSSSGTAVGIGPRGFRCRWLFGEWGALKCWTQTHAAFALDAAARDTNQPLPQQETMPPLVQARELVWVRALLSGQALALPWERALALGMAWDLRRHSQSSFR